MCLKKRLQAVADGQITGTSAQQYLELPRAIADERGLPNKGISSKLLEAWYTTITTPSLPAGWNPECVLFDAIFWLYTPPKKGCTMGQHALTLLQTKLFHYIQRGTKEIYLVFDTPIGFP